MDGSKGDHHPQISTIDRKRGPGWRSKVVREFSEGPGKQAVRNDLQEMGSVCLQLEGEARI